jgi:hypothetical protein
MLPLVVVVLVLVLVRSADRDIASHNAWVTDVCHDGQA